VGVTQRGHVIVAAAGVTRCGCGAGPPGIIGAPPTEGGDIACAVGIMANVAPQLRQNFIPLGFSPRHCAQMTAGNPPLGGGVAVGGGASAVPQFKQNDEPGGLWWPQATQRMELDPSHPLSPQSVTKTSAERNGGGPVCNAGPTLLRPAGPVAVKLANALVFALVASTALLGSACVDTAIRTAPFRVRPDAAEPGSLKGPFSGRVLDSTTKAPIAGALVYAAWTLERGSALLEPAGAREVVGSTDAGGNYKVAALDALPRGVRVTDFTLLIYKRGYVAYRSDRRFHDLGARMDFAQSENQVLLERWRNELSHARHLRFVGSGTAVAALTQWELADASAELEGRRPGGDDLRPGRGEGPYVVAAQLLTDGDIKSRTPFDGPFQTGPATHAPTAAT